ncbi:threonine protease T2 [Heterobasidion irregulare TC 32-1]|uniref:Threonine protease T2 n=1 Tax=Heterobasidion irregulare (strain TC 32-1) TaxID=747525 RepID=W4K5Y4_HETIT|nr:threonine protease T2 [Heterobasidion irregulare TC 32-1]ETW80461.1 threonine protease T2 [Heterobasidion irregulare TC 32-1]
MQEKKPLIPKPSNKPRYVLVIHGGAGTMSREASTPEREARYKTALSSALRAGHAVLQDGGEAMDAAVAAVMSMEDCPLFNSGKGAVFNVVGQNELEASIMLSRPPSSHPKIPHKRRGFSLTLLTRTRNPSHMVRELYLSPQSSPHPFLSGAAAETVGETLGEQLVDPSYFFTEARWREHRRGLGLPETPFPPGHVLSSPPSELNLDQLPTGTVGAVALDVHGCIVAVTSTGGRTNKMAGRIGDTPHMGAGFWAEEWKTEGWIRRTWNKALGRKSKQAVGVSGTGDGDYFIRQNTACTLARRMQYLHEPLSKAAQYAVDDLRRVGGDGGLIAVDSEGHVAMPLNCPGMYRGLIGVDGIPKTAIFSDEELS